MDDKRTAPRIGGYMQPIGCIQPSENREGAGAKLAVGGIPLPMR